MAVRLNVVRSKTKSQIERLSSSVDGTLYFASDSPDVYLGNGSTAVKYSGITTVISRPVSPRKDQIYLVGVSENYSLQVYINNAWETLVSSLTLGESQYTAYRGDRGKTAYDHSQSTTGNPHSVTLEEVGGTKDHTALDNIGTNDHSVIDSFYSI